MFGKDANKDVKNKSVLPVADKAPTSFASPATALVPGGFAKEHKNTRREEATLIASGAKITGDMQFGGLLDIEGMVIGNIQAEAEGSCVLVLEKGCLEGDVRAPKVIVNGVLKGTIYAHTVELAAAARVTGDVHYHSLEILKGAKVNGNLMFVGQAAAKAVASVAVPMKEKDAVLA